MIDSRDVVRLKMPYPNISSDLAVYSHMYICDTPGTSKHLLKVQSFKNKHSTEGMPISNYYELSANDTSNPCKRDSFVDLEKKFNIEQVRIPLSLKAKSELSEKHFKNIISKITQFNLFPISADEFLKVNFKCYRCK